MEGTGLIKKTNYQGTNLDGGPEIKDLYSFKNFELQEEDGLYYIRKKCRMGSARIGFLSYEENSLFYYPSEGMAFTSKSLLALSEFLTIIEGFWKNYFRGQK